MAWIVRGGDAVMVKLRSRGDYTLLQITLHPLAEISLVRHVYASHEVPFIACVRGRHNLNLQVNARAEQRWASIQISSHLNQSLEKRATWEKQDNLNYDFLKINGNREPLRIAFHHVNETSQPRYDRVNTDHATQLKVTN
jgi:hypothetical protein